MPRTVSSTTGLKEVMRSPVVRSNAAIRERATSPPVAGLITRVKLPPM